MLVYWQYSLYIDKETEPTTRILYCSVGAVHPLAALFCGPGKWSTQTPSLDLEPFRPSNYTKSHGQRDPIAILPLNSGHAGAVSCDAASRFSNTFDRSSLRNWDCHKHNKQRYSTLGSLHFLLPCCEIIAESIHPFPNSFPLDAWLPGRVIKSNSFNERSVIKRFDCWSDAMNIMESDVDHQCETFRRTGSLGEEDPQGP